MNLRRRAPIVGTPVTTRAAKHEGSPSSRLHIGIVLPDLGGGGAERAMLTLASSLVRRGYRIDLVMPRLKGPCRLTIPDGVTVYHHRSRTPDPELARHIRARGIDLRALTTGPIAAIAAWRSLRRQYPAIANRLSRLRAGLGVARWQAEADFPLTWYRYGNNRGRNAAVNSGLELVSGDYILILDSDDALLDDALETVAYWRERTGIDALPAVSELAFRCVDEAGTLVGPPWKEGEMSLETFRTSSREARYRLGLSAELICATKTALRREEAFVELTGSEHCPEGVTHNRMARRYDTIFVDRPIRRYFRNDGEARLSDGYSDAVKWPRGSYLRALSVLNDDIAYWRDSPGRFLNSARKVTRLGLHVGRSPRRQFRDLCHARARLLWAAGMPAGLAGYARDRLRGHTASKADPDLSAWGPAAPPEDPVFNPPPRRLR